MSIHIDSLSNTQSTDDCSSFKSLYPTDEGPHTCGLCNKLSNGCQLTMAIERRRQQTGQDNFVARTFARCLRL